MYGAITSPFFNLRVVCKAQPHRPRFSTNPRNLWACLAQKGASGVLTLQEK
jgi:hypothetical protein